MKCFTILIFYFYRYKFSFFLKISHNMFKKFVPAGILFIIIGCANDSTSDLIDNIPVEDVSYTDNVKPIINNNCIQCHGSVPANGAPMSLATYQNVKDAINDRGLIERISRAENEPGRMPLGSPRLPQNVIDIIIQWESEDFPE